jgi:16S rRNA (guanine966-N2)-methyltransferase
VRIVGGTARGRRLLVPRAGTRPTADAVREAVFAALEARWSALAGLRVLDLYAGSGALGLEAVSRGATSLVAVESDRAAATVIRANSRAVAAPDSDVSIRRQRVEAVLGGPPPFPFDLVLADPPYAAAVAAAARVLPLLVTGGWLAADAAVVWEQSSRADAPRWPAALRPWPVRTYGEAAVHIAVLDADDPLPHHDDSAGAR